MFSRVKMINYKNDDERITLHLYWITYLRHVCRNTPFYPKRSMYLNVQKGTVKSIQRQLDKY